MSGLKHISVALELVMRDIERKRKARLRTSGAGQSALSQGGENQAVNALEGIEPAPFAASPAGLLSVDGAVDRRDGE